MSARRCRRRAQLTSLIIDSLGMPIRHTVAKKLISKLIKPSVCHVQRDSNNLALRSMTILDLLLFLLVCFVTGLLIFVGSVLGHSLGQTGLFAGAVVGGFAGVGLATWLSAQFGLLSPENLIATFIGGSIGFIVATIIAVNTLFTPIIPLASIVLIGVGALLGKAIGVRQRSHRQ
jgi:hypothetical protein